MEPAARHDIPAHVSTGSLPGWASVEELVREAHAESIGIDDGAVADYIPELAHADPSLFGLALVEVDGGDVGSLRGTTQNLASAVGTALAGALLVSLLGLSVGRAVVEHPELPPELVAQVDLDDVNFISNDDLRAVLERTDATPEQVDAAVAVNEQARLGTLRLGLLLLVGISAIAILPASRLPRYKPDEIPDPSPVPARE